MRRLALLVLGAALAACSSTTPPTPSATPTSPSAMPKATSSPLQQPAVTATLATGLKAPWSVLPLGDSKALITQRDTAQILLLDNGRTTVAATLKDVRPEGEGGLLGLAMRGDQVYVYYTAATDNRIAVLDFDGSKLSNERTVFSGIPKGFIHNGGRIAFGPDGMLYVGTGETGQADLAQDRSSLGGKILRLRPDGRPAPGNPDPQSPVYSWGHRNVQGLAWDSQGQLWASEFGQNDVDELNLIEPGNNYGWPMCEGPCDEAGMTNPKATWSPTSTASPSGLAILDDVAWVAGLRGEALFEIPLDGRKASKPQPWFSQEYGRLRDVVAAPGGGLWVLTNNTDGRGTPKPKDDRLLAVRVP